jgi:hypothetical protein
MGLGTEKVNGLAARWSAVAPQMISLHRIVHQTVSGELKSTMDSVMATINCIPSASKLQHRLFRMLLSEMSAEQRDLLLHNDVRRLSKGKALKRLCDLRLVEQMRAFQVKLDLFGTDLSTGRMLHFPTLCKCISSPARITANEYNDGFCCEVKRKLC